MRDALKFFSFYELKSAMGSGSALDTHKKSPVSVKMQNRGSGEPEKWGFLLMHYIFIKPG